MDLFTTENALAFLTLASLEIVLGIDNVIFIAILAGKLPPHQRDLGRRVGLTIAVVSRIVLLLGIGWVMKLKEPWFSILEHQITGKDLVLILGGLFLIAKATYEMHHKVSGAHDAAASNGGHTSLPVMLAQVVMIDVVFSLDSVITAVGMSNNLPVMIAAIIVSVLVMLAFSGPVVHFVDAHPAIKLLALAFLLLIGVLLIAEGFHQKIDKGYIYFAMAFSLGIELLNMRAERNRKRHQELAAAAGNTPAAKTPPQT